MSDIRSVAVFGAGGDLGDAIVPALLAAGLNMTIVTREGSNRTFPSGAKVVTADYTSVASLAASLQNIDAVVSLVGHQGVQHQQRMIDAAVSAGVHYFIPSEFGHDSSDPRVRALFPIFEQKNTVTEYLKTKEKDGLSWTMIVTGLWFDWGLEMNLFDIDLKARKAKLWDGGSHIFRTINVQDIAAAVTCALTRPSARAAVKNTQVYISSVETTQDEILAAAEEATGSKFEVENVNSDAAFKDAQARFAGGDPSAVKKLLTGIVVSKRALCAFGAKADKGNRSLLGGRAPGSVKETVKRVLDGRGPSGKWTLN